MDPVQKLDDGWYFYDETWTDAYGPYPTQLMTRIKCLEYCLDVLGNYPSEQEKKMRKTLESLREQTR
jgi:hypothetical protein